MEATKPYEFIGLGAMEATKPYEFIWLEAMEATKPYEFIELGAMEATKPHEFIGFGASARGPLEKAVSKAPCPGIGNRYFLGAIPWPFCSRGLLRKTLIDKTGL